MAGSSDQTSQASVQNDPVEFLPQPSTTVRVLERWDHPRINVYRTLATFFSFIIMGANDAAYGALIPYLEKYYHLTYVVVSLVFLSPLVGYAGAALLNNFVHIRAGQRGVAFIAPFCHLAAYLGIALHPPYPVLVVVFILAGFGNGLADAAWNAWIGNMANSNEVLGFLHGFYGIGAVLSPLAATTLITKAGWSWYAFYYIMLGGAAIELLTSLFSFWNATGTVYRESNPRLAAAKESRLQESLSSRVTWVAALFLLGYVGAEVAIGGWIVIFMLRERGGEEFASGMVSTGFWTGIAIGRFALGFVTPKLGEKFAVMIYIPLAMALQLVFWLVPQFHVSAVAVSLQGFFLGPLFPAAIVAATRLLPPYLHVSAIGFAAAFGGGGAAVLPFGIGALAQGKGVQILQPVILAMLSILLALWLCLPAIKKTSAFETAPAGPSSERPWFNIDIDLVDAGRRVIRKSRGG
ncbi:MFS general substrate transporter [Zopfia rhizophila CBS 207.26]|uniref:MFS general substrate transporter n=1 Tax=Zopfia rhizophila CBS 207.26 TaxID=1314779 RepID=A0A6A6DTU3_9PEZI|nr:MFS general substrate transporter [Zopfia rhizophila CBS 207.26]